MKQVKDTRRANVRISYDGKVYKTFRGFQAQERFENETLVLHYLEDKGCPFVPKVISAEPEKRLLVTTNCGQVVEKLSESKRVSLFEELEKYGVQHEDAEARNVTYRRQDGRFCIIDFEYAKILDDDTQQSPHRWPDEKGEKGTEGKESSSTSPSPQPISYSLLRWSSHSDQGPVRKNNEDDFMNITFDADTFYHLGKYGKRSLEKEDFVFAISDGMGGAKSGEFASKIAIQKVSDRLPKHFRSSHTENEIIGYPELFQTIFLDTHQEMNRYQDIYPECQGMGATLSLCWFSPKWMYFGHIGDSRIYHLPASGGMKQVTRDDTHAGWLFQQGKITEREARDHPRKNALQRALGAGHQIITIQSGAIPIQKGDLFLLCTDGLIDGLWDRQLLQLLQEPSEEEAKQLPAERLVAAALNKSGKDNTTALVIEVT